MGCSRSGISVGRGAGADRHEKSKISVLRLSPSFALAQASHHDCADLLHAPHYREQGDARR